MARTKAAKPKPKAKKKAAKKAATKRKGVARTPPWKEWEEWTEATFWSFVRSGLRSKFQRYPPHYAVLKAAERPSQSDNKRLKYEYQCAICKGWFPKKEVSDDHIIPCGSLKSFDDLPGFVERLAVGVKGRQCLCITCHSEKSKRDREGKND